MNYDYYAEARRLAAMLSREKLNDWELKILGALEDGVTATEILMMLRWNLSGFLSARVGSEEAVDCAMQLFKKVDIALT